MSSVEQSYYENREFWSGDLFDGTDLKRFDFVISHLDPASTSLLDVGCGNGMFLSRVCDTRPNIEVIHGADRSMAALAQTTAPKTRASIDSLPFADRSFDTVTCLEVVEHLPVVLYGAALRELARVAGNQLIVSVPRSQDLTIGRVECTECRTLFNPDYHLHSFSEERLSKLFVGLGFEAEKVVPFGIAEEFLFVKQIDALKKSRRNRFTVDVPCPACGFVLPARSGSTEQLSQQSRFRARSFLKSLWPKVRYDRWLLAVYRRVSIDDTAFKE